MTLRISCHGSRRMKAVRVIVYLYIRYGFIIFTSGSANMERLSYNQRPEFIVSILDRDGISECPDYSFAVVPRSLL